jgi:2-isopropylmalate synthase
MSDRDRLVHDWSTPRVAFARVPRGVSIQDETLREGLRSTGSTGLPIDAELRLLRLMDRIGIDGVNLGVPASSPTTRERAARIARAIGDDRLSIRPSCGGRTMVDDVHAILAVREESGVQLGACLSLAGSPVQSCVERSTIEELVRRTHEAVGFAVARGLDVTFVTEDTTRSSPKQLDAPCRAAVEAGASRLRLCDTVGAAVPAGVMRLVDWARELLDRIGGDVGVDWHGHDDRGLALANALAAVEAGVERVHGTALGLGGRVGDTAMEQLLVNLGLLGVREFDLAALPEYLRIVAETTGVAIPPVARKLAFSAIDGNDDVAQSGERGAPISVDAPAGASDVRRRATGVETV